MPVTPSSGRRRSPGTSPMSPKRSSPTLTKRGSFASAPRSAPATTWWARSPPRERPSSPLRSVCSAPSSVRRHARCGTPRSRCHMGRTARWSRSRCSSGPRATTSRPGWTSWSASMSPSSARSPKGTSSPVVTGTKVWSPRSSPRRRCLSWPTAHRSTSSSHHSECPPGWTWVRSWRPISAGPQPRVGSPSPGPARR